MLEYLDLEEGQSGLSSTADEPDIAIDTFDDDLQSLESDADALLDSIQDPINRLYKISTWVRNPSSRFYSTKAQCRKKMDPETGIDLFQTFELLDLDYVASIFVQYKNPGQDDLERRIALSISRRRRQFAYWKSHREKLNMHTLAVTERFAQPGLIAPSITTASQPP